MTKNEITKQTKAMNKTTMTTKNGKSINKALDRTMKKYGPALKKLSE